MTDLIIFHFKSLNSESDSDVKEIKSKQLAEKM